MKSTQGTFALLYTSHASLIVTYINRLLLDGMYLVAEIGLLVCACVLHVVTLVRQNHPHIAENPNIGPSGHYLFGVYARIFGALDFHFHSEYDLNARGASSCSS